MAEGDTLVPHRDSVMSSIRRTETPAWYMERNVSRCGGEIPIIMDAAVDPSGLVTLIAGNLGQLLGLLLQRFIQHFFHAPPNQFFSCPLITSSFSCAIFSDIIYFLLSEWYVVTSFYQSLQTMSLFFSI